MGKKKIKKQTEEEILKEGEKIKSGNTLSVSGGKTGRQVSKGKIHIQARKQKTFDIAFIIVVIFFKILSI